MDEAATQPATQPFLDPRRHGYQSVLSEEDECDVLCILEPTTPTAYRAVKLVADLAPQHILQNENLSLKSRDGNESNNESSKGLETTSIPGSILDDDLAFELKRPDTFRSDGRAMDIALRLSSKVNDPCLGFTFGRGQRKSDITIAAQEETTFISSRHFRIYARSSGILMLEATSTNGTIVDSVTLRADTEGQAERRRMICDKSRIVVLVDKERTNVGDVMTFIVRIPSRDRVEDRWHKNFQNYIQYISQIERQRAIRTEDLRNGLDTATLSPPNLSGAIRQDSIFNTDPGPPLIAGSRGNQYGMEWNGGETYNVVGFLGQGSFALVYRIATKRDGDEYAAKQIEKRKYIKNGILDNKAKNEINIMKDLEHPHIVKFIGHEETPRHLILIMELVKFGDLSCYNNSGRVLPELSCQRIGWQICSALEHLHKRNITHRDIKPENILVECEEPLNVKLSDFGLSKRITNDDAFLQTFCGTVLYCAPEIYPGYEQYQSENGAKEPRPSDPPLKTIPYQDSVDIWAFAAVLYHLLCACPPYVGTTENQGTAMLHTVMNNEVDFKKLLSAGVSYEGVDFVSRMLKHDPVARATAVECLQHPWIVRTAGKNSRILDEGTTSLGASRDDQDESKLPQLSQMYSPGKLRQMKFMDGDTKNEIEVYDFADMHRSKRFKHSIEAKPGVKPVSGEEVEYSSLAGVHVGSSLSPRHPSDKKRLFDEIQASALPSSRALSCDTRAELEVSYQGSHDGGDSLTHSLGMEGQQLKRDELVEQPSNHPQSLSGSFTGSAPSLRGAESFLNQLNMSSHESAVSEMSARGVTKLAETLPLSESAVASPKGVSQESPSADKSILNRAKLNHLDESVQRSQSGDSLTNCRLTASETTNTCDQALPEPSALPTATKKTSNGSDKAADKVAFAPPYPRLGVLTSVPGSICNATIKLDERFTFYGRDPKSHVRFEDKMDTRVPKNALDIMWWCPGIEAMLAGGQDWRDIEGLIAIIHTRTSLFIRVNGVKLTMGKNHWHFGRLHTGDVITIFGPEEGKAAEGKEGEFLKFRCEFFAGPSAKPREEPFVAEKESKKAMPRQVID